MSYDHSIRLADTRRLLPAALSALLMVFSLASFASLANAAGCGNVKTVGSWTVIQGPKFDSGGQTIADHGVDPADANLLYATNGTTVEVSRDGGCTWKESYAGGDLVNVAGSYRIESLHTPTTGIVGLLIRQETAVNSRPVLEVSTDSGRTWSTKGAGLPPTGDPEFLAVAPNSSTVYVGVDSGGGTLDLLYASDDAGNTFTLRSDVSQARPNAGITGMVVDPLDHNSLWAWGSGGLYHSTNSGASFALIEQFNGVATGPVEVIHTGGGKAKIIVFTPGKDDYRVSNDGGKKWFRGGAPNGVDSITHGFGAEDMVLSAQGRAYGYQPSTFSWKDLGAPVSGIKDMTSHRSGALTYFGHTSSVIERYFWPLARRNCDNPDDCPGILPGDPNISIVTPPEVIGKASQLAPKNMRLVIGPGKDKTVHYRLDTPQRPVPLDVYFLIDTSNSMYETLAGLRRSIQGIINGLAAEKIDVQFGLAEYRAYPYSCPPGQDDTNFVYRQLTNIAPVGPELEQALESLTPDAGGFYDSHLGALFQTATGDGQDIFPIGANNAQDVPAGQQAVYREKALRVVIHATDEVFGRESAEEGIGPDLSNPQCALQPTPDIPSFEEVTQAFNERNMKQVGLSILNTAESSYPDLARVARETDTFATTPVDCDGDGSNDISSGAPLVCELRPTGSQSGLNLVPAVVGLLNSVQDKVDVGLRVTGGEKVVENVSPEVYPSVLLQTAKRLDYNVDFHCSRSQAGDKFKVHLAAHSSVDLPQAVADVDVICKKLPKEEREKKDPPPAIAIVPPLIPTVAGIAAAPPPPPPAPVSNLSSASQAQSQAQAQGATATQEQEEPQLALAQAYFEAMDDEEYDFAMVKYHGAKEYPPTGALFGMGLVAISLMGSGLVAMRRRSNKYSVSPATRQRGR
jgi:hypothetical protein